MLLRESPPPWLLVLRRVSRRRRPVGLREALTAVGQSKPSAANPFGGLDLWFVNSLMVPASLHDVNGRFVHVNPAAEQASGHSNAWWLGRHVTDTLPPEARKKVAAQFDRAVKLGEPGDFETVFIDGQGRLRGVRAQHLPLWSGEAVAGVLILAFAVDRPSQPVGAEREPRLTRRQSEILDLIASGDSTAAIAKRLSLSPATVRNHVRNLLGALQAHSRIEAIVAARRLGLLAPSALKPSRDSAAHAAPLDGERVSHPPP